MLDAAVKALSQILSPPMRSILWRSIGLALVLIVVLAVGLQRLLSWFAVSGEVWAEAMLGPNFHTPLNVLAWIISIAAGLGVVAVLAVRDDEPAPSASVRPSASGAAPTPAGRSLAVRWLEQNTAAGTRLLVPPDLVDAFAAGLPGRQVFPNDQVAARTGDLLVVTPNSGAVLTGTLTQQVLAAASLHDDAGLDHIASVRDRERLARVLLDQQDRSACGVDLPDDAEDRLDQ